MNISNKLIDFLSSSKVLSNSTIILTDLEKVVFALSDFENDFFNRALSNDLIDILNFYSSNVDAIDYFNASMEHIVPIVVCDDISSYKSQMFLPIVQDNCLVGLLIFISHNRVYLKSNLNFAKTTKHFVEVLCFDDCE